MVVSVEAAELRFVERVERLKAQFDARAVVLAVERDVLGQGQVCVVQPGTNHVVLARGAEALTGTTKPRGNRISVRTGAEPRRLRLRIFDWSNQVRTVAASGQTKRVSTGVGNVDRKACLEHRCARDAPSADDLLRSQVRGVFRKRKRINVADVEDLTTVVRARALAVVRIERVRYTAEVARCAIDQVRVGIRKLAGKTPLVFKANTCLQRVIVRVGLVLFLVDAAQTRVDAKLVGEDLTALVCIAIRVRISGWATKPARIRGGDGIVVRSAWV